MRSSLCLVQGFDVSTAKAALTSLKTQFMYFGICYEKDVCTAHVCMYLTMHLVTPSIPTWMSNTCLFELSVEH